MKLKHTLPALLILSILSLTITKDCKAQQDPQAAARQAEIDAAQADVKINQAERKIEEAADMDGVDAPTISEDVDEINQEGRRKIEAIRREEDAENND